MKEYVRQVNECTILENLFATPISLIQVLKECKCFGKRYANVVFSVRMTLVF